MSKRRISAISRTAYCLLEELGAITADAAGNGYKLAPLGRQLSQLPVDPRLARTVLEAEARLRAGSDDHHLRAVDPETRASGRWTNSRPLTKHRRFPIKSDSSPSSIIVELPRRAAAEGAVRRMIPPPVPGRFS
ncbi:hypothetical protein LNP74_21905 [Klebsiella pneumoniae subsp. pneumoniae]|nr:hypothetical protein [Klebsiella pneumoniae subsp. pneumoniae]